ncbi:hypothetical protein TNCV_4958931 [Trichonephila clavipes]|uniref:Uncharacterized protein n=1 Tax=Trichonephila clavipes TaxID=2585209 RepID=A0A8X6VMF0_TRICX|nr:hypothetical protein TNCV_4958931 [Trichonephila clavipes]
MVTPKCLGGPLVDRDLLNVHVCSEAQLARRWTSMPKIVGLSRHELVDFHDAIIDSIHESLPIQTYITCTAMQMVMAELRYECITRSFLIDECRITEYVRDYIVNFVEQVHYTSPDMMLGQQRAVRNSSLEESILCLIDPSQVQELITKLFSSPELLPVGGATMCAAASASSWAEQL